MSGGGEAAGEGGEAVGERRPKDPALPGPFAVGEYAEGLREFLRGRPRILIQGEVTNLRQTTSAANVYFELRDSRGGVPCAIWRRDLEKLGLPEGMLEDGIEVVAAGGPDYYPGSNHASPSFSFRATWLRPAGEGDLLARLEELRRRLAGEGLFEPQKRLTPPILPRAIGVVTAEHGAARRDLLAGLERRGWHGRLIWAHASVQDRHAAPQIAQAVQDLAARPEIDAIVICRGGGSLADLWAFCDETLCRTVAMLRVPVIAAVGHHRDRTLIDDVACISCSTPTHAAEAVVPLDCARAREQVAEKARELSSAGERAVDQRTRKLAALARGPERALGRERAGLNQRIREIRASAIRGLAERRRFQQRIAGNVLDRAGKRFRDRIAEEESANRRHVHLLARARTDGLSSRRDALRRVERTLRAHEPERALARGYALVEDSSGQPLADAEAVRQTEAFRLRMRDGTVDAMPAPGDGKVRGRDG